MSYVETVRIICLFLRTVNREDLLERVHSSKLLYYIRVAQRHALFGIHWDFASNFYPKRRLVRVLQRELCALESATHAVYVYLHMWFRRKNRRMHEQN